jgi:hypothetical protein
MSIKSRQAAKNRHSEEERAAYWSKKYKKRIREIDQKIKDDTQILGFASTPITNDSIDLI